jgi:TRAP-type C4-dicarboxylate transport system permease small subunit
MDVFTKIRSYPIWKLLLRLQEIILVACGSLCCLIFLVEVFMRYVLAKDFFGFDEFVLLFAMWMYFVGGSYAMYKREHISAEMIGLVMEGRTLDAARVVVSWITFVIALVFAIWGIDFFMYALQKPAMTTVWKMPRLYSQSALTVGYVLMSLYGLFYAIEDTVKLFAKKKNNSAENIGEEGTEA